MEVDLPVAVEIGDSEAAAEIDLRRLRARRLGNLRGQSEAQAEGLRQRLPV